MGLGIIVWLCACVFISSAKTSVSLCATRHYPYFRNLHYLEVYTILVL